MENLLNSTTHSVSWFLKRHRDFELQLKAPFQRNPVWSDKQKAYLIDTILRGYPIPELYVQEFTDSNGTEQVVVVDGQQRLRACIEFAGDMFSLDQKDSPEWADMRFSDLKPDDKERFYNYKFVVRVLPRIPDETLVSMFSRLNRNVVALNQQELRHATYWGEFLKAMEELADDEAWSELGVFTANDVRRMLDVEFVAELVVGVLHGPQNKKGKLDDWFQTYEQEFPQRREVKATFQRVLFELIAILPDFVQTRWRKKSDFYTLFLVFAAHNKELPLDRGARDSARHILLRLGADIDRFISSPETQDISENVKKYVRAVERAASDIGNRKERSQVLEAELSTVFAPA